MQDDKSTYKQLVYPALGACQEVHKHLGPFLNEYMYQDALAIELSLRGIPFDKEFLFTADYKGHTIEHRHFADFRVRDDKKSGLPKIFNFWEEEEARPLHLLQRNLIMDRRFRRCSPPTALELHAPHRHPVWCAL